MTKIIDFHQTPVVALKKELKEKEEQLEAVKNELIYFKRIYSTTVSIGDLLKLQMADVQANVALLQNHLVLVQQNLASIKSKIDELEKMRARIQIMPSPPK